MFSFRLYFVVYQFNSDELDRLTIQLHRSLSIYIKNICISKVYRKRHDNSFMDLTRLALVKFTCLIGSRPKELEL